MRLIDTHCHLDFPKFDRERDAVIGRARAAGVERILDVGSSIEGSKRAVALADACDCVYASVGIHPHEAGRATADAMAGLKTLASHKKVVAIGEVGLDYFRNLSPREEQVAAFRAFIRMAAELNLPLILHARDATRESLVANRAVLDILKEERGGQVRGVMHCFSGDRGILDACIDLGLHVSYTCNLTYAGAAAREARELARSVPVERLLLETDAPYLLPQDLRGKVECNEPAYMTHLVDTWAALLSLSKEDVARITTHNAIALFGLGLDDDAAKIAYEIRDSLYLNITNRCTNACGFCVRNQTSFVKGHNLRLDREPSAAEILSAVKDPARYHEVVFCGYGEPTMRLETVREVAGALKRAGAKVRMVTNGHGDLINGRPIAGELKGLIDRVSVSLNTDTAAVYDAVCRPQFGAGTYEHIKRFIASCVAAGIAVEVTCLDLPGVDMAACRAAASALGASFRPRTLGVVG